jgi:hypothetical protein
MSCRNRELQAYRSGTSPGEVRWRKSKLRVVLFEVPQLAAHVSSASKPSALPYLRRVAFVALPRIFQLRFRGGGPGVRFPATVASIRPELGHEHN